MAALIDAHAHLDKYGDDALDAVLHALDELDALTFAVSVDPESYRRTTEIAVRSRRVVPCFGIHPSEAPRFVASLDTLAPLVSLTPMIGEIGLDHRFVTEPGEYPAQREVFAYFLEAARVQAKIVNVHCSGAERATAEMLADHGIERAIIHWYSGSLHDLGALVATGASFTVGVEILRSDHIRGVAAAIPDDRLLTETDNPGGHRWLTGETGEPDLLTEVVAELARVRGIPPEAVRSLVRENTARLIDGDGHLEPWGAVL